MNIVKILTAKKEAFHDPELYHRAMRDKKLIRAGILLAVVLIAAMVVWLRVESSYQVISGEGWTEISGTSYEKFGSYLLKYSPDGASCITTSGKVRWSATYSIPVPILDICRGTAVIAEQQGNLVYVYDEDGQKGSFETSLPILAVQVAKQGVVAVALEDGDVTWINFYEPDGTLIAENRTTINDSGYPLSFDLSEDGMKIVVSYLLAEEGGMSTRVAFYSFDAVGQAEINNLVSSEDFENTVVPLVYFTGSSTAVAIHNDGFSVYRGRQVPALKVTKTFEDEILSTFYDDSHIGFVFASDHSEAKYKIQVYNLNGSLAMQRYINYEYDGIRLQNGNVIVYNEKKFEVYGSGGRLKTSVKYRSSISDVVKLDTWTYLVSGSDSTNVIRVY